MAAYGGVSDVESANRRSDGEFDVVCRDGTRDVASADDRALGALVDAGTCRTHLAASGHGLTCAPYDSSRAHVTRISDGAALGALVGTDDCLQIAAASARDLTCIPHDTGRARLGTIGGTTRGALLGLDACLVSVP